MSHPGYRLVQLVLCVQLVAPRMAHASTHAAPIGLDSGVTKASVESVPRSGFGVLAPKSDSIANAVPTSDSEGSSRARTLVTRGPTGIHAVQEGNAGQDLAIRMSPVSARARRIPERNTISPLVMAALVLVVIFVSAYSLAKA